MEATLVFAYDEADLAFLNSIFVSLGLEEVSSLEAVDNHLDFLFLIANARSYIEENSDLYQDYSAEEISEFEQAAIEIRTYFEYRPENITFNKKKTKKGPKVFNCPIINTTIYSKCQIKSCVYNDDTKPFSCKKSTAFSIKDIADVVNAERGEEEEPLSLEEVEQIKNKAEHELRFKSLHNFIKHQISQEFIYLPTLETCVICHTNVKPQTKRVNGHLICSRCKADRIVIRMETRYMIRAKRLLEESLRKFSSVKLLVQTLELSSSSLDRLLTKYGLDRRHLMEKSEISIRSKASNRPGRRINLQPYICKLTKFLMDNTQNETISLEAKLKIKKLYDIAQEMVPQIPVPPDLLELNSSPEYRRNL